MPENPPCWLILGSWRSRYPDPTRTSADRGVHRLVDVHAVGGHATRVLRWDQLRDSRTVYHITDSGRIVAADESVTYTHLTLSIHGSRPVPDTMPLALLAPANNGTWQVYLPIRLGADDALFHHVDTLDAKTRHQRPPPQALTHTLQRLPAYSKHVGSHECWYFTHDPDIEYEHKFTLAPDTDIYTLARDITTQIGHDELSRYRAEFRNDFELWQFGNHMFDITGPDESDHGYASFIPRLNGGYTIKRKQFRHDGFARIEHKHNYPYALATTDDMHAHLARQLRLDACYLGSFDRIRFDAMLESSETGHIYSLMTDRCQFRDHDATLQQLEIEYIRTRGDTRDCGNEIIDELDHLKQWTQKFLADRNIAFESDYTSKYTYLRRLIEGPLPY
ncbi:hypothetical protein IU487_33430 [Nocardia puris]|uniref:hypothetical protein n=1 Tax=Nocardia puris TaxID=208602 RepID=UPI0018954079|nr:hypothetical protein [Nocardia puris]MBF6215902.1 hypothetical protein [Nocardia puris]